MAGILELPAGFRFHPTDEELVMHYLCRKCAAESISVSIIAEIDIYKYDPWHLPGMAAYGEKEWYFFSPRDRKYPNGSRPNRAAGSGYWKATGADKPIGRPKTLGIKKALVFYSGKAPRGLKTNWIMHEYRLANVDRSPAKKNNSKLDDWVLCRIYNKKGSVEKQKTCNSLMSDSLSYVEDQKPEILNSGNYMMAPPIQPPPLSPVSTPRIHPDSSCSEHMWSPEKEVQSEPKWSDYQFNNYMESLTYDLLGAEDQFSPLQDMFMYLQRPLI